MDTSSSSTSNVIKLEYRDKVSEGMMKELIKTCLSEKLTGSKYDGEVCGQAAKELSDEIRDKLRAIAPERYKFVVQVAIGETRDQGVRFGTRCFWDSNTDNQAHESFINDHIYCVASVFAIYLY